MTKDEIVILADKISSGLATAEEIALYYKVCASVETSFDESTQHLPIDRQKVAAGMKAEIWAKAGIRSPRVLRMTWLKRAAAAVLILGLGTASYVIVKNQRGNSADTAQKQTAQPTLPAIIPGGNKATLTLGDGTVIVLDSAENKLLTKQGNVQVIKLSNGLLSYQGEGNKQQEILYNTISTPPGGQYHLILEDGTNVWLNAVSSLRFPNFFKGDRRTVELVGEGYFEVAHNAAIPFHVKVKDLTVEVLGTHLNINSYHDEDVIKTTLLEGSVQVLNQDNKTMLKPREQLVFSHQNGSTRKLRNVNTEEVIAWKEGRFRFHQSSIETIMRQVARWYNVQIEYKGQMPKDLFSGDVSRQDDVNQLLDILRATNVLAFAVEGNKIVITSLK